MIKTFWCVFYAPQCTAHHHGTSNALNATTDYQLTANSAK